MIDHRRLQRVLFRMQLDPAFAALVLDGGASEARLGPEEEKLLARADLAGILADHGGKRRAQILGNVASEYVLCLAEAARSRPGASILDEFPRSEAFHGAIAAGDSLPLAFGVWIERRTAAAGLGIAAALALLERSMAAARRAPRPAAVPSPGEIALSDRASLVSLPEGCFEHAQALRASLDAGSGPPPPSSGLSARASEWLPAGLGRPVPAFQLLETVLLVVSMERSGHSLREVAPERLEPDVACLLRAAATSLDKGARAALAAERGWQPAELEAFIDDLVSDGVLSRG